MYMGEFPAFIPKLGVMLTLVSPLKSSLASLTYIVQKNGEALVKLDVPSERIKSGKRERAPTQDPSTRQTTRSHFILPPLTVSEPCTLRASIVADGIEYAAGKLHISRRIELPTVDTKANAETERSQAPSRKRPTRPRPEKT